MTLNNNKAYKIDIKDNLLLFSTSSFKTEKGSVLHSGIYNRELSSALLTGALIMILGFFFATSFKIITLHWILALVIFITLFIFFRTYIFLDPFLYVKLDKKNGVIEITLKRFFSTRRLVFPLSELKGIRQDYRAVIPENPDGIRLVEQVALQHGTVIPGFGRTSEFYTVEVEFKDGRRFIIFSSEAPKEVEEVATKFKNFIKE